MVIPGLQKIRIFFSLTCFFVCMVLTSQPAIALESGLADRPEAPTKEVQDQSGSRQIDGEIEALRNEMKVKPTDSAASRLGQLLLGKGALNEAMGAFGEALKLNPRSFEARVGEGVVLGRQGEFAMAEQVLRDALVLNPNPVRVYYELGLLYEKHGDFGKAVSEYKEGLKKYQEGKK